MMKARTLLIAGSLVAFFAWASRDQNNGQKAGIPRQHPPVPQEPVKQPLKPRIPYSDPAGGVYAPMYLVSGSYSLKAKPDDYSTNKAMVFDGSCVFPYSAQKLSGGFMKVMFYDQNNRSQSGFLPLSNLKPADLNKYTEQTCRAEIR